MNRSPLSRLLLELREKLSYTIVPAHPFWSDAAGCTDILGGFSGLGGGPFYGTGYYGGGGLGLILIVVLVLVLLGRL